VETRLESARRRAGTAKRALTAGAAGGFLAAALLAHASHPGHAASATTPASSPVIAPVESHDEDGGSYFTQTPQVQTHVS
jgi:hypothetical protein